MAENTPKKVYGAIAAVQADFSKLGLGKTETNKFQKYDFRGIDALMVELSPILVKRNLIILPHGLSRWGEERETNENKASFRTVLEMEYEIVCIDDESSVVVGPFYGEATDTSDKATNKATSFAYKYMAFQTFCIPIKGQDEGDADHNEVKPKKQKPKSTEDAIIVGKQKCAEMMDKIEALGGKDMVSEHMKTTYGGEMPSTVENLRDLYDALREMYKAVKEQEVRI